MPRATATTRISVPDHVITRVVGGSTVILDVTSGRSFTLDVIGSRVWSLLESTGSIAATVNALRQEFEAEPAALEHDVVELVDRLASGTLLELSDDAG